MCKPQVVFSVGGKHPHDVIQARQRVAGSSVSGGRRALLWAMWQAVRQALSCSTVPVRQAPLQAARARPGDPCGRCQHPNLKLR